MYKCYPHTHTSSVSVLRDDAVASKNEHFVSTCMVVTVEKFVTNSEAIPSEVRQDIRSEELQVVHQWMQHHLEKRRRSESADPQALVPAPSVFELPTQNSLAKGCSPAQCREDSPSDSRCTSGSCSDCANPACPFPTVSGRTGKPHAKFFLCDNKACFGHYRVHAVMRTSARKIISFYVAKCREDNPPGSRCTSSCCSDCANTACPFPRGALTHMKGALRVTFRNFKGQIVCSACAQWHGKHGTWRSEAAVSSLHATNSLMSSTMSSTWNTQMTQMRARLKHRTLALEDPDRYGPTTSGESASCELTSVLLLLHQKRSFAFDCFRCAQSGLP